MTEYCRNLASDAFVAESLEPGLDGELALRPSAATSIPAPGHELPGAGRWYGRILCGRSHRQMTELMAEAGERLAASGSGQQAAMMVKTLRHARFALRHAALARASILAIISFFVLVVSVVLAHETRNTVSIYENYLANPTTARAPQQSWGYTPILYDLPDAVKSNLIVFDRFIESRVKALGLGRSKSGSSSIHSLKLGAAIMSLIALIPMAQFGLGQSAKARVRREKALATAATANARPGSGRRREGHLGIG